MTTPTTDLDSWPTNSGDLSKAEKERIWRKVVAGLYWQDTACDQEALADLRVRSELVNHEPEQAEIDRSPLISLRRLLKFSSL